MGRNQVEGDMIFADVDFAAGGGGGGYYENGMSVPQQQMHRKHRRKKGGDIDISSEGGGGGVISNGDADIVTPYQNGHYTNGYHQSRSRLPHRHSSISNGPEEEGGEVVDQYNSKPGYGHYLSPPPPHLSLQHLLLDEQQQASVNNAITVAPSRTNLNDSNVFAGGRPNNFANKRASHHRNNNRHRHKGRSRTPDFSTPSNNRLRLVEEEPHDSQSILNRIDLSIRKNFGDWDSDEGEGGGGGERRKKQVINGGTNGYSNGKPQKVPFFIPKNVASDSDVVALNGGDDLNLPRLFKPYEAEVAISRKVLNDKSYKVCLSRDNEDPNSILSQAKKTLSFVIITMRRSIDRSKPTPAQETRQNYVESTLREIRERRLSHDATAKGIFPERTPSRMLSPAKSLRSSTVKGERERPTLSLTKLDFELLRDWDWKERRKRLETWVEDLGLTKGHAHFKKSERDQTRDDARRAGPKSFQERRAKQMADRTSAGILKKELEHLTGLRVYAPGDSKKYGHHIKRPVKPTGVGAPSERARGHGSRRESIEHPSIPSSNIQVRQSHFNHLIREADEALEAKKTFGRGWNGRPPPAKRRASVRKMSLSGTLASSTVSTSADMLSITSGTTLSSQKRKSHHHHHHRPRSQAPTMTTMTYSSVHHGHSMGVTSLHPKSVKYRTDIEEEQPSTSYHSATSRKSTRPPTGRSSQAARDSSSSSPSEDAPSIAANEIFRGLRMSLESDNKSDEGEEAPAATSEPQKETEGKYKRPHQPLEYQDFCFGRVTFVDRSAVKPVTKVNKGYEFYMTVDDEAELDLGMGRAQAVKVKFFKESSTGKGRSNKVLARKITEKARKAQEKEERKKAQDLAEAAAAAAAAAPDPNRIPDTIVVKDFAQLAKTSLFNFTKESGKSRKERLMEFEKALMELPGISSKWHMEVSAATPARRASQANAQDAGAVQRISKRAQFTRPARRIWYTPLPLTIKKYYRTNWKKIRFDIRNLMKDQQFWPKLWINFEESHPKKLFELIKAKLAVKDFDKHGFKRVFDWGRGVHPDYIDWILEDIVPHPGRYYFKPHHHEKEPEAVRRASVEETDFRLRDWFVKPPRYLPDTPLSPPFDQFEFCGYGNREKPFFLAFTLPREILHYYAPPSNIQKFFRKIPKPPYAFPGYTFKRWLKYPLEQKLPQYCPFPKRFMQWTRGKVGEPVQCLSSKFYNDDPYIIKRDIRYSPYHDSHTRKYILRKDILDKLWAMGIINSKGEVKCSMAEFNQNRLYLREYEWLEEAQRRWDLQWNDRMQQNNLTKETNFDDLDWEEKKKERMQKLENCKRNTRIRDEQERRKFLHIVERTKRALEVAEKRKEKMREAIIERARVKQKAQIKRRITLHKMETFRKYQLQRNYEDKSWRAEQHRERHFLEKVVNKAERERDRWERHLRFHQMKMIELKMVERELENEYRMRVRRHKIEFRRKWEDIRKLDIRNNDFMRMQISRVYTNFLGVIYVADAIIRKKLCDSFLKTIALKYARIWMEKVRKRRTMLPDEKHFSKWTNDRPLEATVRYLREKSGYVDMNTFFFSTFRKALHDKKEGSKQPISRPPTRRRNPEEDDSDNSEDGNLADVDDEEEARKSDVSEGAEEDDDDDKEEGYDADKEDER